MKKKKKFFISAIIILSLIIFCYCQNNILTVSNYVYSTQKISDDSDGFRIIQISDLHNKKFGNKLTEKIKTLDPDIIAITGDIVDSNHTNIKTAVEFAKKAVEIAPTYYITGNHEYWLDIAERNELFSGLENAGVRILENETVTIQKNNITFSLTGIDDNALMGNFCQYLPTNENTLNILLAHEPQYIEQYSTNGNVDLVLTGHAHGGQFRLPFIGGIIAPDQGFFPKYTSGLHTANNTSMIISRGLGNSVIPLRLFNLPDIVCVDLENSQTIK